MHAGNTDTALDHLNGIYQLGQILEHEPVMVSQLVRIAIHGIGVGAVGSLLSPGELTPQQVRQVTSMLRQMDYRQGVADSLWGETQAGLSSFDAMRAGDLRPELIGLHGTDRGDRLFQHLYSSPLGRPWLNLDEAAYAEVMGQMTQAAPAANFYEAIPALQAIRNEIEALPRTRVFTRALTPALTVYLEAPARATAQNELAQIGLTLELQYHGQAAYPADLYEIESAFGSPLPLDPYSGQPYRYEQLATGFLLYSIGSNLQDDGGRHIPRVLEGDIVWRGAP
ncbi:MAG: hypothetical protein HYV26_12395 [Candidatus Hydrogenedentes bacterium]|nr:hypothetical protein [Candidatus Hydrogenedentota bacterium]